MDKEYHDTFISESDHEFSFRVSQEIQRGLAKSGIFLTYGEHDISVSEGTIVKSITQVVEPFTAFLKGPILECGSFGYIESELPISTKIGRYCSIAKNVRVMGRDHPLDRITTHSFTYWNLANIETAPLRLAGSSPIKLTPFDAPVSITIGHDVWIGQDVLIRPGVHIGTGSVIAAGAVVVKNVPEFAVVGGNPAKLIRFRFDEALVEKILKSQWWDFGFQNFGDMSTECPTDFLSELETRIYDKTITPFKPERIDVYRIVAVSAGLLEQDFDSGLYLERYGDVRDAKSRGEIRSAEHHYVTFGRREGRT